MTPPRPPSIPDANALLVQHEKQRRTLEPESLAHRQETFEQWVKGVFEGQASHARGVSTQLGDQDVAMVAISRALGIDEKQLPRGLVQRSLPPPPDDGPTEPTKPQRRTLPIAHKVTLAAMAIVFLETMKEGFALARVLLGGH